MPPLDPNLSEQDVSQALQGTLEVVDTLRVIDKRNNLVARGGFMLNMAFLDGDQLAVRERFWALFDHYCRVLPLQEMVWWRLAAPRPGGVSGLASPLEENENRTIAARGDSGEGAAADAF